MNIQTQPASQANLRVLFVATIVYWVLTTYCLIHFFHVAHYVSNQSLLPLMSINLGAKAIFFDLIFICIHIAAGFLLAFPFWLPLLIKSVVSSKKISKVINWFCIIALLLFVPLNNYLLSVINSMANIDAPFNTHFFILFIPMMAVTVFTFYTLIKFEFRQK